MNRAEAMAAVKARPKDPQAWLGLGQAMAADGDIAKARDCYQRALGFDPNFAPARQALAALDLSPREARSLGAATKKPPATPPSVTKAPTGGLSQRFGERAAKAAPQPEAESDFLAALRPTTPEADQPVHDEFDARFGAHDHIESDDYLAAFRPPDSSFSSSPPASSGWGTPSSAFEADPAPPPPPAKPAAREDDFLAALRAAAPAEPSAPASPSLFGQNNRASPPATDTPASTKSWAAQDDEERKDSLLSRAKGTSTRATIVRPSEPPLPPAEMAPITDRKIPEGLLPSSKGLRRVGSRPLGGGSYEEDDEAQTASKAATKPKISIRLPKPNFRSRGFKLVATLLVLVAIGALVARSGILQSLTAPEGGASALIGSTVEKVQTAIAGFTAGTEGESTTEADPDASTPAEGDPAADNPDDAAPTGPIATLTVSAQELNLRAGPGPSHPILGVLPKGTKLEGFAINPERTWVAVRLAGKVGWVSLSFVEAEGVENLPSVDPATVQ
jgi:hypothetical protein